VRLGGEKAADVFKGVYGWGILRADLLQAPETAAVREAFTLTQVTTFCVSLQRYYENCLNAEAILERLVIRQQRFAAMQMKHRGGMGPSGPMWTPQEVSELLDVLLKASIITDDWQRDDSIDLLTEQLTNIRYATTKRQQFSAFYVLTLYCNPPPHLRAGMRDLWSNGFRQQRETFFHSSPFLLHQLKKNARGGISLLALSQSDAQDMKEELRNIHKRKESMQRGCHEELPSSKEHADGRLSMDDAFDDDDDISLDVNWKSLWATLWIILSLL